MSARRAALAARRTALEASVVSDRARLAEAGAALVGPLAVVEVIRDAGGQLGHPPAWVRLGAGAARALGFGVLGGLIRAGWAAWVGGRTALRSARVLRRAERALPS